MPRRNSLRETDRCLNQLVADAERAPQQLKGAMVMQLLVVWPQMWVIAKLRSLYFSAVDNFDRQFIRPKGLRAAING
jgi:hypothetical protein